VVLHGNIFKTHIFTRTYLLDNIMTFFLFLCVTQTLFLSFCTEIFTHSGVAESALFLYYTDF